MIATLVDTLPLKNKIRNHSNKITSDENTYLMELDKGWIRYQIEGDGPTLVIACDPPSTLASYQELLKYLSPHFKVVLMEQPGFGFSYPKVGFDFSFKQTNNLIADFLVKLDLAPYVLSLPCVTGFSAIVLADQYPKMISHLVLIQTPDWEQLKIWANGRDSKNLLRKPVVGQLALMALKNKRVGDWYDTVMADQENANKFTKQTRDQFNKGACFCLASGFQKYLFSGDPDLPIPSQPVLAIWGEKDLSHGQTLKRSTLNIVPHATFVTLDHCGHSAEIEDPEAFVHELRSFLSNN